MTPDEAKAEALAVAQQLFADLQNQALQFEALAAEEQAKDAIRLFVGELLEPLARRELEHKLEETEADIAAWEASRQDAYTAYEPQSATLAHLEGSLAQAIASRYAKPDPAEMDYGAYREAMRRYKDDEQNIADITGRIELLQQLTAPMTATIGTVNNKLDAARAAQAAITQALAEKSVLATAPGQAAHIFRDLFMLYSGLWFTEPDSPIGLRWLKLSGQGARIEAHAEAGARADVAAHGPEFRSAPSAVPLWGTTSEPGVSERWGTASESGGNA